MSAPAQPPPGTLGPEHLADLDQQAAVFTPGRLGIPAILARLPLDVTRACPVTVGPLRLYRYEPEGPIAVLALRVYRHPMATGEADPHLPLEVYLDPASIDGRALLVALSLRQSLLLHIYSTAPSAHYVGTKVLNWTGAQRKDAASLLEATDLLVSSRWPAARTRYLAQANRRP